MQQRSGLAMKSVAIFMCFFVFTPAGGEARPQTPGSGDFQISVNVDLVALEATITDKNGRIVPELHEPNFQIYEDGVKQDIRVFRHEDVPVTAGLVIDHSGSMHPKLAHVIEAARTFVRSSNPEDQMFVINFNEHASLGLPRTLAFTDRPEELEAAISRAPASGKTALYDAIVLALDRLQTGTRAKKVLIVMSDGGDNASVLNLPAVMKKAMEFERIDLCDRHFRRRRPRQKSGRSAAACARHGRRSFP